MGRASCGCTISMRSILTLSKMWNADAKFAKRVSSNTRKGKMQMQFNMIGRLKSICKFKEKQVADTLVPKRASATENIKPVQIQRLPQRASATANIKRLQIHQLPKEYLHKRINREYRYISSQKSKFFIASPISITVHHKARKDYAIQRIGVGLARRS